MKQRSENRKALPKFILIILGALVLGFLIGLGLVFADGDWTTNLSAAVANTLAAAAPWLLYGTALVSALAMFLFYRKAKRLYKTWQEEDEGTLQKMARLLSIGIQINGIAIILSYFFVAIPMCNIAHFENGVFFLCLGGFVLQLVVMVVGQQKLVDFSKKLYPEKRGSIYDPKFQKVWFESCDEAERAIIGQACYTAYKATNTACLLLWLALVLLNMWFDFGLLPIAVVTVIWLVSAISYFTKSFQLERRAHGSNGASIL